VDPSKGLNPLEDDKKQIKVQYDENDIFLAERQEHFVRLYEDPMFLMMKEKARRKEEIYKNPLKMKEIFEKIAFEKAKNHVANIENLIKKKKKSTKEMIQEKLKREMESGGNRKMMKMTNLNDLRKSMGFNIPQNPIKKREDSVLSKEAKKSKKKSKKSKKTKKIKKDKKKRKKKKKKVKKEKKKSTSISENEESNTLTDKLFNDYLQKRVGPNVEVDMLNGRLKFKNRIRKKRVKKNHEEEFQKIQKFRKNQQDITEAKTQFLKDQIKDQEIASKKSTPDFLNKMNQDAFVNKYGVKF
jgi:hypothetical protein